MSILEVNCDPYLGMALCRAANVCGYISNGIWFFNLLPQLWKNHQRQSVAGLSLWWATCNFTASLFNVFFVFRADLPAFSKVGGVYMPVLEFAMLVQFALYGHQTKQQKAALAAIYLSVIVVVVSVESTLPTAASPLVWISIVLWSIETYFQIILNMKRKSVIAQSYISLGLTFIGKSLDFFTQFSLIMPQQYVYMTYFSSSFAYINVLQWIHYSTSRRWKYAPELFIVGLLIAFAVILYFRAHLVSIVCPILLIVSVAIGYAVTYWLYHKEELDSRLE